MPHINQPLSAPRVPPPLPVNRGRSPLPPPLPGQRQGEFDPNARVHSGRDVPFLPGGQLFGQWVSVNSTNVNRIMFEQDTDQQGNRLPTGSIYIEFLSLALYKYPGRTAGEFMDLFTSSSKGRFSYYQVRGPGPSVEGMGLWQPFIKLRGASRSASEVRRLAQARQPRTERQRRRFYNVGGRRNAGGGTPSVR